MALKDIVTATKDIHVGDASFTVRGITLANLVTLSEKYTGELGTLLDDQGDATRLITKSPEFIAATIALASGEDDVLDTVLSLPVGIQLNAILAIWELSAISEDDLGNVMSGAMRTLQKFNQSTTPQTDLPQKSDSETT